ncbi:MAG: NAD(P)-dependent alcohol dehydrogenase [Anaerolineae bacterium]|nr:NAD(P)-dependent alcohol dehydrogenase [Promineifilum sp.]MCW5846517.1 NAD(P)-dependent alcohol dehydrogenase [Anaerolineae bacterium]
MKAIINTTYGSPDVLRLVELETPTPAADEVLIRIHAASVNAYDWHLLRADPFLVRLSMGFFRPRNPMLGADVAGQIVAIGRDVTQFKPGDEIYGDLSACGNGGFAEYVAVPEKYVARKPASLTFEQAAAVPMAAVTALQGLRDVGSVQPGHKVLINGASGGVGTFAVQIAKALGAEVTAVCSTSKIDLTQSLGADHVIDYAKEDFTRNGRQYDLILAVNGDRSLGDYERVLMPNGTYAMVGGSNSQIFQALLRGPIKSRSGGKRFTTVSAKPNQADLEVMNDLIETGRVRPVVDRCYPLSETAEALRYVEAGHARGKVVITIAP